MLAEAIETPCLRQLFLYWDSRRQGRAFPARHDLDPLDFRFALGHVSLIDVNYEPLRFRFRLHGSELTARAGYDMTGKPVEALPNAENRATLVRRCHAMIETRQPMRVLNRRPLGNRRFDYEAVWLPLARDGETIDMLMLGVVYRDSGAAGPLDWGLEKAG
jgi:hypothetical protein